MPAGRRGQLIGERYGLKATLTTPLEGSSMVKSVVASLIGVLMQQGAYPPNQPAAIPQGCHAGGELRPKPGPPFSNLQGGELLLPGAPRAAN